jgi:hypothetical protein
MRSLLAIGLIAGLPLMASCTSSGQLEQKPEAAPGILPSTIPPDKLVGSWGLGAYHQEGARARTETAARRGCNNPYKIAKGPNGGLMMYLADARQPSELVLKGGPDGKNYIGPEGPVGDADRELTFDGNVMVMRWLDPEVASRYGTMVYVRCR